MKRPICPRCGRQMGPFSKAASGKQRYVCRGGTWKGYCYSTTDPEARGVRDQGGTQAGPRKAPIFKRALNSKRYLITAAQNATPAHEGFLASLLVACKRLDAELVVIPIRYKNPTSRWEDSQANAEYWWPSLAPYLYNQRKALCKNLVLLGDIKTQPTASSPLAGFEAITHGESGILGHTKLQLRCIPTPQHRFPKILTTTGAVTVPNYTDSKIGKVGEFHHTLGAALVEIQGSQFHLRQINASKDGSFYDLDKLYTPDGVTGGHAVAALVMGDTHVDFIDPTVERATFGRGGIIDTLKPTSLVWHDLSDGYSVNHHHGSNPFPAIAKRRTGRWDAEAEVRRACEFVKERTRDGMTSIIVASNHNDFLRRWIVNTDWRGDPGNAEFYLQTALDMVRATKLTSTGTEYPNAFVMWAQRLLDGDQFKVLQPDESYMIAGIEVGMHGDVGPTGARGSIRNLRRIGVRSVIGHSHTPGIDEGAYQAGTSTKLKAEYTSGPTSWLNSHVVIYPSGKRSLVTILDGTWRI